MSDIIKNIRVNVDFDPDGNIRKAEEDLANAAKGSNFEAEIKKMNGELNKQAILYAAIADSQNRLKAIEKDREKFAGTDKAKSFNDELRAEKKFLKELQVEYKKLASASKNSFETAGKAADKARGSFINLSDVLTTALGTSIGISVANLADFLGEAIVKIGDYIGEGLKLAATNEKIAEGSETTNQKLKRFNEVLTDIQTGVGRVLLPFFRGLLDILNDIGEGFADFLGTSDNLSEVVIRQQLEFNNLTGSLERLTREAQSAELSEAQLAIVQEQRRGIIEKINGDYPDYLDNLLTEETSIDQIRAAQKSANEEFLRRIQLLARQEELQELTREAVKIQKELFEVEKERTDLQKELEDGVQNTGSTPASFGGSINVTGNELAAATARAASLREQLEEVRKQVDEIGKVELDFEVKLEDTSTEIEKETKKGTDSAREILENTVAFLRERLKELREELEFVVEIDDFESRQKILSQIQVLNNQIAAANAAFEVTALLKPDSSEIEKIEPIEVPVNLNIPDAQEVINASRPDSEAISKSIFDPEDLAESFETALDFTQSTTSALGSLFDTLAENRINRENLTDEEIREIQLKQFERQKAFTAVEAGIQGALMAIKFGTQSGLPGFLLGASLAAAQVVAILARQAPGFKEGVFALDGRESVMSIKGPGTGTSDSILSWLSRGETVVSAERTIQNYNALKAIDSGQTLKPYQVAGQTVFSATPLQPQVQRVAYPVVVASNSGIDYDRLADAIAKRSLNIQFNQNGKIDAAKAFAKQNEFMVHEILKFLERKGVI